MEWTIRLLYVIILTSITGSICFGAWYVIGKFLEKRGYTNILYSTLRASLIFWCFPFAFIMIEYKNNQTNEGGGFLFFNTPVIKIIGSVFIFVWLSVVIISFVRYMYYIFVTCRKFSNTFDCNNEVEELFYAICDRIHIKNRSVKVCQSYKAAVPACVGIIRPVVVLPVKDYKGDELEVIFVHELTHYKHKDAWMKHFTFIVSCFHCFNPLMYFMKKQLDLWGEYACDYASIQVTGSVKNYFQVILNMALPESRRSTLYSPLFEKKVELECRIEHMQRSQKAKKKSKLIAFLCVLAMAMAVTVSVFATTVVAEKAYMSVYDSTVEEVYDEDEIYSEDVLIEYEESGLDIGVIEEESDSVTTVTSSKAASFSWNVSENTVNKSTAINVEAEGAITVTAICNPNTETFRIGIIEPDGVRRYVSGTNMLSHTFTVRKAGTHYVYVQNMSLEAEVTTNGVYGW